jgi:hypothetical protein
MRGSELVKSWALEGLRMDERRHYFHELIITEVSKYKSRFFPSRKW